MFIDFSHVPSVFNIHAIKGIEGNAYPSKAGKAFFQTMGVNVSCKFCQILVFSNTQPEAVLRSPQAQQACNHPGI